MFLSYVDDNHQCENYFHNQLLKRIIIYLTNESIFIIVLLFGIFIIVLFFLPNFSHTVSMAEDSTMRFTCKYILKMSFQRINIVYLLMCIYHNQFKF